MVFKKLPFSLGRSENEDLENKDLRPETQKTKTLKSDKAKTLQYFSSLLTNQVETW